MNKFKKIYYLTDSREIEFVKNLADVDLEEISNEECFREKIIKKMFLHETLGNSTSKEFYNLKNKYLYLFTEGAIRFLEANTSMGSGKEKLSSLETRVLQDIIGSINDNKINILSLGAGTSKTEINAIKNQTATISYYALDVSLYLLELGIIDFIKRCQGKDNIKFESILADIWDASKCVDSINELIERENVTIFTLLGTTIGNYPEKEIMEKIISLMRSGDYFILGYDVWKATNSNKENKKKIKNILFNKYNTIGNLQFLIQPFKYIPKYSGYTENLSKYFKISQEKSVLIENVNCNEYDLLTDIKSSVIYAPYLELPSAKKQKIRIAQSTKYYTKDFDNQDNDLTSFINSLNFNGLKLTIQKTYGKKDESENLGVCVSVFKCEECKAKTRSKKESYAGTGES